MRAADGSQHTGGHFVRLLEAVICTSSGHAASCKVTALHATAFLLSKEAEQRTRLGVSRLLSLFISTSMPLLRATAMQFFWSPMSMPATLILADAAVH